MAFPDPAKYDYRFWPTKEQVTLQLAGPPPPGATVSSTLNGVLAMRTPPRQRVEQSPMGAQYIVTRVRWSIPGVLLQPNVELFPGDKIVANTVFRQPNQGTTTWTVESAELNHLDTVWQLDCLKLQLHPRIQQPIQILRPALFGTGPNLPQDITGSDVYQWVNVYPNEPAAVLKQDVDMETYEGQVGGAERWLIVVGRQLTITSRDKVYVGATGTGTSDQQTGLLVLDVEDYNDTQLIGELPHMVCKREQ